MFSRSTASNATRSKRKRVPKGNAIQRAVKREAGKGEGGRALYHCRGCFKDISSEVRIRCAECHDLDLCVHCFCR